MSGFLGRSVPDRGAACAKALSVLPLILLWLQATRAHPLPLSHSFLHSADLGAFIWKYPFPLISKTCSTCWAPLAHILLDPLPVPTSLHWLPTESGPLYPPLLPQHQLLVYGPPSLTRGCVNSQRKSCLWPRTLPPSEELHWLLHRSHGNNPQRRAPVQDGSLPICLGP